MILAKLTVSFIVVNMISLSITTASNIRFRANAVDFVKVGYKTVTRRGELKEDYSKLEIEAQPLLMVEESSSVDKSKIRIEIKSGDDSNSWRVLDTPPSMRGGVYRWTESNIEPCVNHRVRMFFHGQDGSSTSLDIPRIIPAATLDEITSSGYRPHTPEDMKVTEISSGGFKIEWSPVKCSLSYDVTYQEVTGGKAVSKQVLASMGNTLTVTEGIAPCSEYEIRVSAVIGDEYSDEIVATYSTLPKTNSGDNLAPIIEPDINSVLVRWKGFESLSCVDEYLVSVCKSGEKCSEGQKVERDDSLQFIEFRSPPNLEECSQYQLNIKPVHKKVEMEEKVVKFRTHSHPVGDMDALLTNIHVEVDDEQMIAMTWDNVKCANHYEIFKQVTNNNDRKWEKVMTTSENFYREKAVPCTKYKYGVKVIVNDKESEIVESDQVVSVPPVIEHPTLVVHKKTDNSVIFTLNNHERNNECKVVKYHIKYGDEEDFIDPDTLDQERMIVEVQDKEIRIDGRIKYEGYDWTSWVSSDAPVQGSDAGLSSLVLVPVIVISVVAVIILSLAVILIRRTRNYPGVKYDQENMEQHNEENKKLKDDIIGDA